MALAKCLGKRKIGEDGKPVLPVSEDGKTDYYKLSMSIPSELVPYCPVCGEPMAMNIRMGNTFVEDEGFFEASDSFQEFLDSYEGQHILFLELGVGNHTPEKIKYPFWQMTLSNENAVYGLNISQYDDILLSGELPNNLAIAQKLVMNKYDVFLLSNPNSTKSADFILRKRNCLYYVEGKTSTGGSALVHQLEKGAKQANRIVIDFIALPKTRDITQLIQSTFNNHINLVEIMLFKGKSLISIKRKDYTAKDFAKRFKQLWYKTK